jgi:alkylation response protein AidB-like acyl-CoA dehydrogenase
MDLTYSVEQRMLRDSVARFVAQHYAAPVRKRIAAGAECFDGDTWRALAGFGWLGVPLPEAWGGFGGGAVDVGIVMEELGKGLVLEPYQSTVVAGAGLIVALGSAEQCGRWLPRVAQGELRLSVAHGERDTGYDPSQPTTRAEPAGDGWRLTGAKHLVLDGPVADAWLVSAQVARDPDPGVTVFFVPRGTARVEETAFRTVDGRTACQLRFDGAMLGAEMRVGTGSNAAEPIRAALDRTISAGCAEAVGCMQVLLDATVSYAKTRVQFGQPIASNQVLRHRMVDMAVAVEEARAMALRAALHADAPAAQRARAVSGAKLKIARAARFVAEAAVQGHGAMGVTEELEIGAYVKRLLRFEMAFGTSVDHHRRAWHLREAAPSALAA